MTNFPSHSLNYFITPIRAHFEYHAKDWMETTLTKLKSFRPYAKWGYYRFPDCHDNEKAPKCSPKAQVQLTFLDEKELIILSYFIIIPQFFI